MPHTGSDGTEWLAAAAAGALGIGGLFVAATRRRGRHG
ncbi:LPXTG cell wall anchor domain-containing protein [Actinacidiphila alni]